MKEYPIILRDRLFTLIDELAENPMLYVKHPGQDFTRDRKLPLDSVMKQLISMGGSTIYKEMLEWQGYDLNIATTSAFVQQRNKILPCAFEFILHGFTQMHTDLRTFRGYRLLASDGSDLHIATNPNDHETFCQNRTGEKGYNRLHLNALYDLCNRLYVDALVQPDRLKNEGRALCDMVKRSQISGNVIVVADRGYESYNNIAQIREKGWYYLIRVKDVDSNGILSGLPLPSGGEFDLCCDRILTRKQTNKVKALPDVYRFINPNTTFDLLNLHTNMFYPICFRVVRFKITEDTYETIITNLEQDDFSPMDLKELYAMRWGIETSFRDLKHSIGLTNFHSKKREHIEQEIFAKILMYNFAEMITSHVVISQSETKHAYQVNFTVAVQICRSFLRKRNGVSPPDVEALIRKNILPIRPNRRCVRKTRSKTAVSFIYRVA